MKTLQNTSVETVPAVAERTIDNACLSVSINEHTKELHVIVCKSENADPFVVEKTITHRLAEADYDALQTDIDTFLNKVWDKLKTNSLEDFT